MFKSIPRAGWWVAAAFVALLAAARFIGPPHPDAVADGAASLPVATPPGITLQQRTVLGRVRVATLAEMVFADSLGMSLYSHDKNGAGTVNCPAECAAIWSAALAPSTATATADWTLLNRPDGTQQWVYRGAPLYRYANDKAVGDATGDGADGGHWHVAVFNPGAGMVLPDGVAVREIADAGGAGLVGSEGLTLYAFRADASHPAPTCDSADCRPQWIPLEAPAIGNAVGQF